MTVPRDCSDWYFRGWHGVFKLIKMECFDTNEISPERMLKEIAFMERELAKCKHQIEKSHGPGSP